MLALLFVACTGAGGMGDSGGPPGLDDNYGVRETVGDPACENLLLTHCMLPFPSDRFRVSDGRNEWLDFGDALPRTRAGTPMSGSFFLGVDGYGVSTPILLQWEGATLDGLPEVFHPEQSLSADSGSVMIDADTGAWIPHWAERDYLTADLEDPLIILRPAVPLPAGHRVVVALRGLRGADGALLEAPAGFAALRDQAASEVVGLHARRLHFDQDVFPVLEDAGLDRGELQLAWDFTVATSDDAISDLLAVRDQTLAIIGERGPSAVIDSVEEDVDEFIEWKITGRAFIPSFLLPPDDNGLRLLRRDDEGVPVAEGNEEWPFTLQIPRDLPGGGQAGVLQYGHGFLGSSREADNGWLREMARSHGFLILATNLQGMDEDAAAVWMQALADDPGWFPWFSEPVMQGLANQLALQRMMVGGFLDETDPRWTDGGAPLYDPERVWYAGNSQGGTMGTLMMALSTDVTRGGLGVPGAAYPFLLHRSTVFTDMAALLTGIFEEPVDASLLLALLGTGFNRIEPLVYAPHIADDPLPDTPEHAVLLHVAKEDSQVHNQVSFLLGRAVGARIPEDAVEAVWGLDTAAWPMPGPASLVEYDFGVPADPTPMDPPPAETDTHGWLRKLPEAQDQLVTFLETGQVIDVCGEGGGAGEGAGLPGSTGSGGCFFDGEP